MLGMRLARQSAIGMVALLALAPVTGRAQEGQSKGWVGIVITTGVGQTDRTGSMVFGDYPVIESIEPGSPAEKAGLQSGDIVISINSQDMRKNPIPPRSMLEPGQKAVFKVRRNDVAMTATVDVKPRPEGNPEKFALSIIAPLPPPGRAESGNGGQRVMLRRTLPPMVEMSPLALPSAAPSIVIAGALLTQLNNDMRDALSVKGNGLLVINVESGTPAGIAGLRGGDVILKADKMLVGNPGELIRIIRASMDNALRLDVIRKRKPEIVTLRW
jgi:serine protease Do